MSGNTAHRFSINDDEPEVCRLCLRSQRLAMSADLSLASTAGQRWALARI
tara:strand:- start:39830 stop:39979 length:150 start_codon:yes stop_codon:yes gene_type:complete